MGLNSESEVTKSMVRVRRSISWDPELLAKVDRLIKEDYHFNSRSHFVDVVIREYLTEREKA